MKFLWLLLLTLFWAWGSQSIKIGVLAKRGDAIATQDWSATAHYLNSKIPNTHFEIVPLSFEALNQSVADGTIDFVLTNSTFYVELEHRYGISRIATLQNKSFQGTSLTQFGGVIFTRKASKITTLQQSKGKRFAAVNLNSFGGWVMGQKELFDHGITPDDFASFSFLGSHDAVVMAVAQGSVDVGTVRSDTLERMAHEGKIALEDFTILSPKNHPAFPFVTSTVLYPEWPFAKLSHTPQELANRVLIALLEMPSDSDAAKDANITGWTIPLDYSSIHRLMQVLHIGPYAKSTSFTLTDFIVKYRWLVYSMLLGFVIVFAVMTYIARMNRTLHLQKKAIEELNDDLERKVAKRTNDLVDTVKREKYLKSLIKTIADVNELLITSYSQQMIFDNSIKRLIQQPNYRYALITFVVDGSLKVVGESQGSCVLKSTEILSQSHLNEHASQVIQSGQYITENFQSPSMQEPYWLITLPIRNQNNLENIGAISVVSTNGVGFESEEIKILQNLVSDIGLALDSIHKRSAIKELELEKVSNYEETILAFVNIIEQRDSYTAGHTLRVAHYSTLIAKAMQIPLDEQKKLEKAAVLHDIGKVVTPDAVLLKPGHLSQLEYELIKEHATAGYKMLSKIDMYRNLVEIILFHHARYDGQGYPPTSGGTSSHDEVPFLAYILSVADAFDAMTTNRIYKPRKKIEDAIEEILLNSGTQFHPEVARVAAEVLKDISIESTTQLPENELEQRRFAYFFLDHLTDVYNEEYLATMMNNIADNDVRCLYRIELAHFSAYNRKHGWEMGNQLLKAFAHELKNIFTDAQIFRFRGDNFILLFHTHHTLSQKDFAQLATLQASALQLRFSHFDLSAGKPDFFLTLGN